MASQGAKILQTRSVAMAMKHRVRVQVLSSFGDTPGTLVVDEDEIVEQELVSGIAYSRDEAKVTLTQVADRSEEHTSELQSLMRNSYAVFCLKKKTIRTQTNT